MVSLEAFNLSDIDFCPQQQKRKYRPFYSRKKKQDKAKDIHKKATKKYVLKSEHGSTSSWMVRASVKSLGRHAGWTDPERETDSTRQDRRAIHSRDSSQPNPLEGGEAETQHNTDF